MCYSLFSGKSSVEIKIKRRTCWNSWGFFCIFLMLQPFGHTGSNSMNYDKFLGFSLKRKAHCNMRHLTLLPFIKTSFWQHFITTKLIGRLKNPQYMCSSVRQGGKCDGKVSYITSASFFFKFYFYFPTK